MENFKLIGKKIIVYIKKNINTLLVVIYCVLGASVSSDLIFKYGEARFFLFFLGGGLVLIFILKVLSIRKSKNDS